jgi:hypothetical protein
MAILFFIFRSGNRWRCGVCEKESLIKRKRERMGKLIVLKGGACSKCSYKKSIRALSFHHRDPSTKSFGLAIKSMNRKWEELLEEVEKCDLLCLNCHREEEAALGHSSQKNKKGIASQELRTCLVHGEAPFLRVKDRKVFRYRCQICLTEKVGEWRRRSKKNLVDHFGGKCIICNYNKSLAALDFHHRDREDKKFGIGNGSIKAYSAMVREAEKCDLLCANCHAEKEAELVLIPSEVTK